MKHINISTILLSCGVIMFSCERDPVNIQAESSFHDFTGPLKGAADFAIGIGIDYTPYMNDATYKQTINTEAKTVTFGYQMKHGAIVQGDGALNFSKADELFDATTAAGLEVYGHTLGWHQNQNAAYLNSVVGGGTGPAPVNLLANPGFESGSGDNFDNWSKYNGGTSFVSGTGSTEIHGGTRSLKVVNPSDNSGGQWKIQLASDLFNTTVNTSYKVSFWIKASVAGGSMRLSTQPTASYQGDQTIGTDWTNITWTFTAKDAQTRILFDMGAKADTYFVDDVSVVDAASGQPPAGGALVTAVTDAMGEFITGTVTHYKGKVKAWDVVNEALADGSSGLRTKSNTTVANGATDVFFWSQYLGKDWALRAFEFAKAADPDALLFINDYALESNGAKLDSLISYVNYLKDKGAKIDGIGTQMHISINTPYNGIDVAFQKLAATGLKIRISELDVRANPTDKANFDPITNPYALAYQAVMYNYVVKSYLNNVPQAQRYGITIWGVSDKDSWYATTQSKVDAPLLFDKAYAKKPSYAAVFEALKGK